MADYRDRLLPNGAGLVYSQPWQRRMRAQLSGVTVLDSERGVIVYRTGSFPIHYFPLADFDAMTLQPADTDADGRRHWNLTAAGGTAGTVVHGPTVELLELGDACPVTGAATLDFGEVDRWFEEDDPLYAHIRDPYHRVDVRSSDRRVVVQLGSTALADSSNPKILYETGLPPRYYLPFNDVALQYLTLSDTVSECPYKGDGQHWNVIVDDTEVADAAWSLPHPLPEGFAAAEHVCFYVDRLDVTVDGKKVTE